MRNSVHVLLASLLLLTLSACSKPEYDYPPGRHPGVVAPLYHPKTCPAFFGIPLPGCPFDTKRRGYVTPDRRPAPSPDYSAGAFLFSLKQHWHIGKVRPCQ